MRVLKPQGLWIFFDYLAHVNQVNEKAIGRKENLKEVCFSFAFVITPSNVTYNPSLYAIEKVVEKNNGKLSHINNLAAYSKEIEGLSELTVTFFENSDISYVVEFQKD